MERVVLFAGGLYSNLGRMAGFFCNCNCIVMLVFVFLWTLVIGTCECVDISSQVCEPAICDQMNAKFQM